MRLTVAAMHTCLDFTEAARWKKLRASAVAESILANSLVCTTAEVSSMVCVCWCALML